MGTTIRTMSAVGKKMKGLRSADWDTRIRLRGAEWTALMDKIKALCDNNGNFRTRESQDSFVPKTKVFFATDSSDDRAAAVLLIAEGGLPIQMQYVEVTVVGQFEWSLEDADKSINWKETTVALKSSIKKIKKEGIAMKDTVIFLAEDYMTAIVSLRHFFYTSDLTRLCGELLEVWGELEGARLEVMYTNTKEQPADEPSRHPWEQCSRDGEWKDKCLQARAALDAG